MKLNFTYMLLVLVTILGTGCLGSKKNNPTPTIPDGTYSGQFRLIHIHDDNTSDTTKASIKVYISPVSTSTYAVTGDTTTVHAGSKGSFVFYSNGTVQFTDKTYSATAPVTKTHLNGLYAYAFDGNIFRMVAYGGTANNLVLQYDLAKSGN